MYLFLQNIRATIILTIAVPVVILGTFAILSAVGFTINTLTMFGMVLAIGLLVDDAIVVVENVERVIAEDKLPPKEATHKSMGQIQRALVGIAVVLSAVFMPMAFMSGATGEIYRQFSITLISSMLLSVFVAMSLTPALCATILKAVPEGGHKQNALFVRFNHLFEKSTSTLYRQYPLTAALHGSLYGGLPADLCRDGSAVSAYTDLLLAGRGSGGIYDHCTATIRFHDG